MWSRLLPHLNYLTNFISQTNIPIKKLQRYNDNINLNNKLKHKALQKENFSSKEEINVIIAINRNIKSIS